jgi:phosphoglycolate phosphatase-like HAD superfamily hydrolase
MTTLRALVAFDIDGTLIDTRPSFDRIVRELSGATDDDLRAFRAHGGFNDDWELARAATCWIAAGRPRVLERCADVGDVVTWCGHDPGDLAARGRALYLGGRWRDERPLVDGRRLQALSARLRVAACTGRDRAELALAEELLGFAFPASTTADDVRKPAPSALLRLVRDEEVVVLIGDTHADRRTLHAARAERPATRFVYVHASEPTEPVAARLVDALLEGADVEHIHDAATRLGEA